jgi:hypothetical protein
MTVRSYPPAEAEPMNQGAVSVRQAVFVMQAAQNGLRYHTGMGRQPLTDN